MTMFDQPNTPKLFIPNSSTLTSMIMAAEAKFEHAREQAALRKEAADNAQVARWQDAAVKARYYRSIQLGVGR